MSFSNLARPFLVFSKPLMTTVVGSQSARCFSGASRASCFSFLNQQYCSIRTPCNIDNSSKCSSIESSINSFSQIRSMSTASDVKKANKETKKDKNDAAKSDAKAALKKGSKGGDKKMTTDEIEAQVNNIEETEWMQMFLDKAQEVGSKKIPLSEDIKKRNFEVGKEYNRQTSIRDNVLNRDLTDKIWLQQDAFRALPESLRADCLLIDESPPPEEHVPAIFTMPPSDNFDYTKYIDSQEVAYEESTLSKNN